jgi:hypothetical protein
MHYAIFALLLPLLAYGIYEGLKAELGRSRNESREK